MPSRHALHATARGVVRALGIFGVVAACGGKSAGTTHAGVTPASAQTLDATKPGLALRGVAGNGASLFAAYASDASALIEARAGTRILWSTPIEQRLPGTVSVSGALVAVALSTRGSTEPHPSSTTNAGARKALPVLRGEPASLLAALDAATGAVRWQLPFESTTWALITSIASDEANGFIVGGTFGGTLRVGAKVVTSAGGSDGFVARVDAGGTLVWLVRMGGELADGVQGVAVRGGNVAIAGTFSIGADILGEPLESTDDRSPFADAFVAELDIHGARRWSKSFGSRADDAVAGVAIDAKGRVVVAANVHEVLSLAGAAVVPKGDGDALLVWFGEGGETGTNVLIGGTDFDGVQSIAAVGDRVVIGGFFRKDVPLGDRTLHSFGSDDAFIAALDGSGTVEASWDVAGQGREEITSLAAVPGGFVAGIAHTADLRLEDASLPAPADPLTGAAIAVRSL